MKNIYTAKVQGTTGTNSADSYESTRKADVLRWAKNQAKERSKGVNISVWNGSDEQNLESIY